MAVAARITPSPTARQLYSKMVARSDRGTLGLEQAILLGVERFRNGVEPGAEREMYELLRDGWIAPDQSTGGWFVGPAGSFTPTD